VNRGDVAEHELSHLLAASAGLLLHGARAHKAGLDLIRASEVYITASPDFDEGTLGEFSLSLSDTEAKDFAMGCCALAPDVTEEKAVEAIRIKNVSALINTVSDTDLACYQANPASLEDVVVCGMAAKYFLGSLGHQRERYIELVDTAARRNDDVLRLADVIEYDRLKSALALAKQFYRDRCDDIDPAIVAQRKDDQLRRNWERKQAAKAAPAKKYWGEK
jgi:hypothetical protein